jgi:hypothetical protein
VVELVEAEINEFCIVVAVVDIVVDVVSGDVAIIQLNYIFLQINYCNYF